MTTSLSASDKKTGSRPGDRWIPWYFVLFFAVIGAVDATMVTVAVKTQTGIVTDQAYEKGLGYDKILDEAEEQGRLGIHGKAGYDEGKLTWSIKARDGSPITGAKITAHFFRPTQDGHDFEGVMNEKGNGLYELEPNFPLPGMWTARLEAEWQNPRSQITRYDTRLDLIAR